MSSARTRSTQSIVASEASIRLLSSSITRPKHPGESNFFVDLWSPGELAVFAGTHGLTNNRALFMDSHGLMRNGTYVLRPHRRMLSTGDVAVAPEFTLRDVAMVLGEEASRSIHNVVLAGCNEEGGFDPGQVRHWFRNATNVTYMAPGWKSYKPLLHQALLQSATEWKPMYAREEDAPGMDAPVRIFTKPEQGSYPLEGYWAELYRPGELQPYLKRRAGRELLESGLP